MSCTGKIADSRSISVPTALVGFLRRGKELRRKRATTFRAICEEINDHPCIAELPGDLVWPLRRVRLHSLLVYATAIRLATADTFRTARSTRVDVGIALGVIDSVTVPRDGNGREPDVAHLAERPTEFSTATAQCNAR